MYKKTQIIVVESSHSNVKSFEFSKNRIKILIGIITALLLFSFIGHFQFVKLVHFKYLKWNNSWENNSLQAKMDGIQEQIANLDIELLNIFKFDDKIRAIYNIEPVSKDVRLVGIGGKDIGTGIDSYLKRIDRQIAFEDLNLKNVHATLNKKISLFSRTPIVTPVSGRITSGFGVRVHPVLEKTMFHEGIDIANEAGSIIYAPADGEVSRIAYDKFAGKYMHITHGNGYKTHYAHLEGALVTVGQKIKRFQPIATMGKTGRTTGAHLHYEVRVNNRTKNPRLFMLPYDKVVD